MRIRSVSTAVVEANFDWTIVRIEDGDGRVGWGECFFAPGLTAIVRELGRLLVGQDARQVEPLVGRLRMAASGAGSNGGIVCNALSGIDAALWDLAARTLDVPLWQLLGGRVRERVRLYADCHADTGLASLGPLLELRPPSWAREACATPKELTSYFDAAGAEEPVDLERLAQRAERVVAAGFDAVKFDVDVPDLIPEPAGSRNLPPAAIRLVGHMLEAVARGAGGAVDVALDCHWRYDLASSVRIAEACAGHPVLWLEDAMPADNVEALARLAARSPVPLGGGENLCGWAAFDPLIRAGTLAVATPDFGKLGGVAEARALARIAERYGVALAPHNIAGPVGTAFAAQLAATMPNLLALEFHAFDVPFFADLVDGVVVDGGAVPVGDRPGIGIDVVEAEVRRWAKPGEAVFGEPIGAAA